MQSGSQHSPALRQLTGTAARPGITLTESVVIFVLCSAVCALGVHTVQALRHGLEVAHRAAGREPKGKAEDDKDKIPKGYEPCSFAEWIEQCPRKTELGTTCPVCLVDLALDDEVVGLNQCGHVFHAQCLEGWFAASPKRCCPLCRCPVARYTWV